MSDDNLLERAKALRETALPRRICSIPGQTGYGNPSLNKGWDFSAVDELVRVVVPELIAEVERLRSLTLDQQYMMDDLDKEIASKDARIKELEEANRNIDKRRDEMAAFIERLEAAFLDHLAARLYYEHYPGVSDAYSWHDYPEDACHSMPKEEFRKKARDALEEIKTGGKDE